MCINCINRYGYDGNAGCSWTTYEAAERYVELRKRLRKASHIKLAANITAELDERDRVLNLQSEQERERDRR